MRIYSSADIELRKYWQVPRKSAERRIGRLGIGTRRILDTS
jgi:hypothetical protein